MIDNFLDLIPVIHAWFVPLVAAGVQIAGQLQEADAAAASARFNAQQFEQQARVAREQAKIAANNQRRQTVRRLGAIRAGFAASGVTVEGSPLEVLAESATNAERDRILILKEGEARARGFQNEATLSLFSGASAQQAGRISAVGTLLPAADESFDRFRTR